MSNNLFCTFVKNPLRMIAKFISNILLILSLSSCAIFYQRKNDGFKSVVIHGTIHKPYCGGARPPLDIAAGYYELMSGQTFKVFKGESYTKNLTAVGEFTFDEAGNATVKLLPGKYMLLHADKTLPLDQFMAKYAVALNMNYVIGDTDCFNTWKNSVDLPIQVTVDTVIEYRQKSQCWVGTNPCLKYIGPPAP